VSDSRSVEAALAGLRVGYNADGYDLRVDDVSSDGVVSVRISAGPDACAECLVPKPIAVGTIKASLRGLGDIRRVEVVYPTDS
jgi:hypothetical protein